MRKHVYIYLYCETGDMAAVDEAGSAATIQLQLDAVSKYNSSVRQLRVLPFEQYENALSAHAW
jgi:hypothetical protein